MVTRPRSSEPRIVSEVAAQSRVRMWSMVRNGKEVAGCRPRPESVPSVRNRAAAAPAQRTCSPRIELSRKAVLAIVRRPKHGAQCKQP